ncbi:CrcB family protein [Nocardioides sp. cx-173]|uniref:fluoride efflux transporter FluC n=1 Tax=Nocardioides sp. cx-173 TaxID=2898796 RepID=UPI001E4A99D8|nr:CrcB family protein [Nocardioides sp. cx-173]MCD4523954.1 CrcB family protein [Nocardioides sp. cx-173]UGB41357.1 CrcB family protein [Nocardioides sp. cx-173]
MSTSRPAYLRTSSIGLVLVGGGVGAGAQEGLSLAVSDLDGVPVVVPVVNLLGAFLLGYLYEALTRRDPGPVTTARLKLLLGTGFCGGLTTYSSLATDTAVLLDDGQLVVGLLYAVMTVSLGAAATIAGIVAGGRGRRRGDQSPGEAP